MKSTKKNEVYTGLVIFQDCTYKSDPQHLNLIEIHSGCCLTSKPIVEARLQSLPILCDPSRFILLLPVVYSDYEKHNLISLYREKFYSYSWHFFFCEVSYEEKDIIGNVKNPNGCLVKRFKITKRFVEVPYIKPDTALNLISGLCRDYCAASPYSPTRLAK